MSKCPIGARDILIIPSFLFSHMFYGAISEEENSNSRQPLLEYVDFMLVQTDFRGWFHVWRMDFPENYENGDDFLTFANENKYKFVNVVKNEMEQLGSVKVVIAEKVNVNEDGNEEVLVMEHYFGDDVRVFQNASEEEIKEEYENFVDRVNGEIENWSEAGTGWEFVVTEKAYLKVARYEPLRGETYIPLPPKCKVTR